MPGIVVEEQIPRSPVIDGTLFRIPAFAKTTGEETGASIRRAREGRLKRRSEGQGFSFDRHIRRSTAGMLPLGLETSSPRNRVQIMRSRAMPCKTAAQTLLLRRTPQGPGSAFSGSSFRLTPMPWRAQRIMRIRLEMEWMRSSAHSDLRLLYSVFSW